MSPAEQALVDEGRHVPAPPQSIGDAHDLVYCKACGFLLSSGRRGVTETSRERCRPVKVGLR